MINDIAYINHCQELIFGIQIESLFNIHQKVIKKATIDAALHIQRSMFSSDIGLEETIIVIVYVAII